MQVNKRQRSESGLEFNQNDDSSFIRKNANKIAKNCAQCRQFFNSVKSIDPNFCDRCFKLLHFQEDSQDNSLQIADHSFSRKRDFKALKKENKEKDKIIQKLEFEKEKLLDENKSLKDEN